VTKEAERLAAALKRGDRRALARAITLVESTRADHRHAAEALLEATLPAPGNTVRLAISGAPGVGKSTFIERLGLHLIGAGHRVAVLAVDPSSKRGGGAILGDKTRMAELARHELAFIRPSPSGATLGGVARRTREAILICEAAGFDVVLVETVGVGQSETAAADLVDLFLVLLAPGGGDELQGIKRGIIELADILVVNKADGDFAAAARRTVADYKNALRLLRGAAGSRTEVVAASALTGVGIEETWRMVERHRDAATMSGARGRRRAEQTRTAFWAELGESLLERLRADPRLSARLPEAEARVLSGAIAPAAAAREVLEAFWAKTPVSPRSDKEPFKGGPSGSGMANDGRRGESRG
jgi:LAO/AO transport system kinase